MDSITSEKAPQRVALSSLDEVIELAKENLLREQEQGKLWNFFPHLGLHFISEYVLFGRWLGRSFEDMGCDPDWLKQQILSTQLADGTWKQLPDENHLSGELNATIFNYAALKVLGISPEEKIMQNARCAILGLGGIDSAALFTKIILAAFGSYSWERISYIPYFIFQEGMPIHHRQFSQWVSPHLIAIAYLRHNQVTKNLGETFTLAELFLSPDDVLRPKSKVKENVDRLMFALDERLNPWVVKKILSWQQPQGSWGGYTLSTILCLMVLDHYRRNNPKSFSKLKKPCAKGFSFVENLYFKGRGAYLGALMDGHVWDTVLSGNALMTAGTPAKSLLETAEYIVSLQQPNGAFPYGYDFEYAPDADDTAEAILFLHQFGKRYQKSIDRATAWLCEMQNRDGGWGAFDHENTGNLFLKLMTKDFRDSVDLFDVSSSDVTGHVMEALGTQNLLVSNSKVQRMAVNYLKKMQCEDGSWLGRWGVNYIYGTSASVCGLVKAGESPKSEVIQKAIYWLTRYQNEDGGFGETTDSYVLEAAIGRGVSTPSQSGLALLAFCAAGAWRATAAKKAAAYLEKELLTRGKWIDQSVVGTGHPGLLYMNYPAYAYSFPLLALATYRTSLEGKRAKRAQ